MYKLILNLNNSDGAFALEQILMNSLSVLASIEKIFNPYLCPDLCGDILDKYRLDLGVVDMEWALCMRHQISLPHTTMSHR